MKSEKKRRKISKKEGKPKQNKKKKNVKKSRKVKKSLKKKDGKYEKDEKCEHKIKIIRNPGPGHPCKLTIAELFHLNFGNIPRWRISF